MIHELSKNNSVFNQYIAEIRDVSIQTDPLRFRKNLERIAELLGYEISKSLEFESKSVQTPLGIASMSLIKDQPVIASILRAGLTMHTGLLNIFDRAENAFISAYREEASGTELKIHVEYLASPDLTGKTVILADPMLATGGSLGLVYKAILRNGTPKKLHVAAAIASQQGIDHLLQVLPADTDIWVGAIDPILNDKSYIVPGLGDAGDLAFGQKL